MSGGYRYEIILGWSDVDQAYIAQVPELPGCIADGDTYREALTHLEAVIAEWIDTARRLGRAIPEPRGRLGRDVVRHDGRISLVPTRDPREMRGFLAGIDTTVENDPERV